MISPSTTKPLIWNADASPMLPLQVSRRKEERILSIEDHVWIQWSENGECLGTSARLVNVSRGGAMIVAARLFQIDQVVHLFLEHAEPEIHGKATVLGVLEGNHGFHQIRVVFDEGCPDTFYQAAAFGFEAWLGQSRAPSSARTAK